MIEKRPWKEIDEKIKEALAKEDPILSNYTAATVHYKGKLVMKDGKVLDEGWLERKRKKRKRKQYR